jgi:hypothetical protein
MPCTDAYGRTGMVDTSVATDGTITMRCVQARTLTLTQDGAGFLDVYQGNDYVLGCNHTKDPCTVKVPADAQVRIVATAGTLGGTTQSWGGACAGVGTVNGRYGNCYLTMNTDKAVSATFVN